MSEISTLSDHKALHAPYAPCAAYYLSSDCVEYVREDAFCIYDRVDGFLTLIFDETGLNVIGFKIKGFKNIYERRLKPIFELHDMQFIDLVSAIEAAFTEVGHKMFSGASADSKRARSYKAALKLAANDNVKLSGSSFFKKAA